MVASVEVRPRRSIAPVLKKVSVDLLTIAQPLGLSRREQWLLPVERLSDRHPLFRNGHSRQNGNHRSDFDRGSPMIRHDRLHPWQCDQARTLGLWRHCECEVPHLADGIQKITPQPDGTRLTAYCLRPASSRTRPSQPRVSLRSHKSARGSRAARRRRGMNLHQRSGQFCTAKECAMRQSLEGFRRREPSRCHH
jgi:hypothetical protein